VHRCHISIITQTLEESRLKTQKGKDFLVPEYQSLMGLIRAFSEQNHRSSQENLGEKQLNL